MTFWDSAASAARWMARVVFPLPPFWEITAIVFTSASTPVCQPTCLLAYSAIWQASMPVSLAKLDCIRPLCKPAVGQTGVPEHIESNGKAQGLKPPHSKLGTRRATRLQSDDAGPPPGSTLLIRHAPGSGAFLTISRTSTQRLWSLVALRAWRLRAGMVGERCHARQSKDWLRGKLRRRDSAPRGNGLERP
jgi:hypothetical protein